MECLKCGKCCTTVSSELWKGVYLTIAQIQKLIDERKKHPKQKGCKMLTGKICLVHKMFGFDVKPDICRSYNCGNSL
jgi:hypothetical protein